jgi:hypothetical protein
MSYIDNSDFFKDLEEKQQIMRKKASSYCGLLPSQDFDSDLYQLYLKYGTPNELVNDVITKETYETIVPINYYETDLVTEETFKWFKYISYEDECEPKVDVNLRKKIKEIKMRFRG